MTKQEMVMRALVDLLSKGRQLDEITKPELTKHVYKRYDVELDPLLCYTALSNVRLYTQLMK